MESHTSIHFVHTFHWDWGQWPEKVYAGYQQTQSPSVCLDAPENLRPGVKHSVMVQETEREREKHNKIQSTNAIYISNDLFHYACMACKLQLNFLKMCRQISQKWDDNWVLTVQTVLQGVFIWVGIIVASLQAWNGSECGSLQVQVAVHFTYTQC